MTKARDVLRLLAAASVGSGLLLGQQLPSSGSLEQALKAAVVLLRDGNELAAADVLERVVRAGDTSGLSGQMAVALTTLGAIRQGHFRFDEAEQLYKRAVRIWERGGETDADWQRVAITGLASIYYDTGRFALSEKLVHPYLARWREGGGNAVGVAVLLYALGAAYEGQRRYTEADSCLQESLGILRQHIGQDAYLADLLTTLGRVQMATQRFTEAHDSLEQALILRSRLDGDGHWTTISPLVNMAFLHMKTGEFLEAERRFNQALSIAVRNFGLEHPLTGQVLLEEAAFFKILKRKREAQKAERQAKAILAKYPSIKPNRDTVHVSELVLELNRSRK